MVSLEVAEHLSKASASNFVKNLVNAGEVILFSIEEPKHDSIEAFVKFSNTIHITGGPCLMQLLGLGKSHISKIFS